MLMSLQEILKSYDDNPKINIIKQNNKGLTISNNVALENGGGMYISNSNDSQEFKIWNRLSIINNYPFMYQNQCSAPGNARHSDQIQRPPLVKLFFI